MGSKLQHYSPVGGTVAFTISTSLMKKVVFLLLVSLSPYFPPAGEIQYFAGSMPMTVGVLHFSSSIIPLRSGCDLYRWVWKEFLVL